MNGIGVVAEYKYTEGKYAGKIFRKRFERTEDFIAWMAVCKAQGNVRILKFKQVETGKLYWVDRYVLN
jgi:hypothetical protein